MELKLNDFVLVESKVDLVKQHKTTKNVQQQTNNRSLYEELINESSNTNYSIEEEIEESNENAIKFEYIIQIKSISCDSLSNKQTNSAAAALLHGKVFLRPSCGTCGEEEEVSSYKLAELVSVYENSDALEIFDIDSLKFKCCVSIVEDV